MAHLGMDSQNDLCTVTPKRYVSDNRICRHLQVLVTKSKKDHFKNRKNTAEKKRVRFIVVLRRIEIIGHLEKGMYAIAETKIAGDC